MRLLQNIILWSNNFINKSSLSTNKIETLKYDSF